MDLLTVLSQSNGVSLLYIFAAPYFLHHFCYFGILVGRKKSTNRLSDHFRGRISIDSLGTDVPIGDDPIQSLANDCVIGIFDESGQTVKVLFTLFSLRNIPADCGSTHNPFQSVPDGGHSEFHLDFSSVLAYPDGLEMIDNFIPFQALQDVGNFICPIDGDEHTHGLSYDLCR